LAKPLANEKTFGQKAKRPKAKRPKGQKAKRPKGQKANQRQQANEKAMFDLFPLIRVLELLNNI
jgi:hypothetical protein